jgi:hypothetical protein
LRELIERYSVAPTFAAKRCPVRSTPALFTVLLALPALVGEARADEVRPLHFKGADGAPMSVERLSHGFLLAADGLFSKAEKGPMIVYTGP